MKKILQTAVMLCMAAVFLSGCGTAKEDGQETEKEPEEILYPVVIGGNEIRIGETTMQTVLDDGLMVTVSEMTDGNEIVQYEVDPEAELETNCYYSGGAVRISEHISAGISFVTDEESGRMGDAVIARIEFDLSGAGETELEEIIFNGVPAGELSREKAEEIFPEFEGDEGMLFEYGRDYEYMLFFDAKGKMLSRFSVARNYEVDWSDEE